MEWAHVGAPSRCPLTRILSPIGIPFPIFHAAVRALPFPLGRRSLKRSGREKGPGDGASLKPGLRPGVMLAPSRSVPPKLVSPNCALTIDICARRGILYTVEHLCEEVNSWPVSKVAAVEDVLARAERRKRSLSCCTPSSIPMSPRTIGRRSLPRSWKKPSRATYKRFVNCAPAASVRFQWQPSISRANYSPSTSHFIKTQYQA